MFRFCSGGLVDDEPWETKHKPLAWYGFMLVQHTYHRGSSAEFIAVQCLRKSRGVTVPQ